MRYPCWLQEQPFDPPAHQIALQEMVEAVRERYSSPMGFGSDPQITIPASGL